MPRSLRIVGGAWRGRQLASPPGRALRPTSARAREALFDMLENAPALAGARVPGAIVLDAFAGTGALGLEALSRGAERAIFVENGAEALAALTRNIAALGAGERAAVLRRDATRPGSAPMPARLAFLDPPYRSGLAASALDALAGNGWFDADAVILAEIAKRESFAPPRGFIRLDGRCYGAARIELLRWAGG